MSSERRFIPESKKQEALRLVAEGQPQATVARTMGVHRGTLNKWIAKANGAAVPAVAAVASAPRGPSVARGVARPVLAMVSAADDPTVLRARIRELEEECATLRRAIGYVSRGAR